MTTPNINDFKNLGWPGIVTFLILALTPFAIAQIGPWRQANLADKEYSDNAWKSFASELRVEIRELKEELKATQAQLWSLKGELRFLRQAEEDAPVAIWELNASHEIKWFNRTFKNIIWIPTGINPDTVRGKKWDQIYPYEVAKSYMFDDSKVRSCRCPITNSDLYTIDAVGNRTYWQTTKWPIIQDGIYSGLKGLAWPIEK